MLNHTFTAHTSARELSHLQALGTPRSQRNSLRCGAQPRPFHDQGTCYHHDDVFYRKLTCLRRTVPHVHPI
jgi:hypothetical protein